MFRNHQIIKGTLVLTISTVICRILGFLYRIFLSNLIGAEGMGIFQLIFPVLTFCVALSSGGIQIAVSRFIAESKSNSQRFLILLSSIIMSLFLSFITFGIVYLFSEQIATGIIKNSACKKLLEYSAITIPLAAFHACISGYYLGLKKTFVPAWSTVFESVIKVISLYIIGMVWISKKVTISPLIAVYSMVISEFAGMLFCLIAIAGEKKYRVGIKRIYNTIKVMFSVTYILTLNRIMLTFLQCMEAILIPIVLMKSGLSEADSLSTYGILTGMALPVIMFPSAISTSVSTMILPTIAKANSTDNALTIKKTTELSIWFSIVSGIFCIGMFLYYGDFIGSKIFGHPKAGEYIIILAWLCPFMYLSITLGSILHGLGKTTAAFIHNVISIAIRLICLWWIVPNIGIIGYLWGLLLSNLVITALHYIHLYRFVDFSFSAFDSIIKPTAWLIAALAVGYIINYILSLISISGKSFQMISAGTSGISICVVFGTFFYKAFKQYQHQY